MSILSILKNGAKLFDGSLDNVVRAAVKNSDIAIKSLDHATALTNKRIDFAMDLVDASKGDIDAVLKAINESDIPLDAKLPMQKFFKEQRDHPDMIKYMDLVKTKAAQDADRLAAKVQDTTADVSPTMTKAPEPKVEANSTPAPSTSATMGEEGTIKNSTNSGGGDGVQNGGKNSSDDAGGSKTPNHDGPDSGGNDGFDGGRGSGGDTPGGSGGSGGRGRRGAAHSTDPFTPTPKAEPSWGGSAAQRLYDYGWQFPVRVASRFISQYHTAMYSGKWAVEAQHAMRQNSIVTHLGDIDPSYLVHGHNYFPQNSIGALPSIKKLRENIGSLISGTGNSSIRGVKDQVTQTHQDIQGIINKLENFKGTQDPEAVARALSEAEDQILKNKTDFRLSSENIAKAIGEAQNTSNNISTQADKLQQNIDIIIGRDHVVTAEGNMVGGKALEKKFADHTEKAVEEFDAFGERSIQRLSNVETSFDDFVGATNDKLERIASDFSGRTPEENIAKLKNLLAALETQSNNLDDITKTLENGFDDDALSVASKLRKVADEARDGATYKTSDKNLFTIPGTKLDIHQLRFERKVGLIARDASFLDYWKGNAKFSDYINDYNTLGKIFQKRNNFRRNIERAPGWAQQRSRNADGTIDKQAYDRHLRNQILTGLENLLKVSSDGTGGRTVADEAGALDSLQWLSYTYGKEGAREGGLSEDLVNFLKKAKEEADAAGQDTHFLTDEFLNKVSHIQSRQVMVGANNVRENLSHMSSFVSGTRWYGDTLSELAHPGRTEFGAWGYVLGTPFKTIMWPTYYPYQKVGQYMEWLDKIPVVGKVADWNPRIPIVGIRLPNAKTMATATVGTAVNPVAWAYFLEEAVWEADGKIILDEDGNPVLGEDGKPLRESYGQDTQLDLAVNYGEFVLNTLDNIYLAIPRFAGELLTNDQRSVYSTFRWMMDRDDEWIRGTNNWNLLRIDDNATLTPLTKAIDILRDTPSTEETPAETKGTGAPGHTGGDELKDISASLNRIDTSGGATGQKAGESGSKTGPAADGGKTGAPAATTKGKGGSPAAGGSTGTGGKTTPNRSLTENVQILWNTAKDGVQEGLIDNFSGNTHKGLTAAWQTATGLTENITSLSSRFVESAGSSKNNRALLAVGAGLGGAFLLPYIIGLTPLAGIPILGSLLKFGAVIGGFVLGMGLLQDNIPLKESSTHMAQTSSNGHGLSDTAQASIHTNFKASEVIVSNQNHDGQENLMTDQQFSGMRGNTVLSFADPKVMMPDSGNGFKLKVLDEAVVETVAFNGTDYDDARLSNRFDAGRNVATPEMEYSSLSA